MSWELKKAGVIGLRFKKLREGAILPKYQTDGSAGFDFCGIPNADNLRYCDEKWEDGEIVKVPPMLIIPGRSRCLVPTGWAVAIPPGYEMQIRPRSGLAVKFGISVLNSPGTIDSDYRGEICVILYNTDDNEFVVKMGDRIAQGVISAVVQTDNYVVDELDETARGTGGLGSTGV